MYRPLDNSLLRLLAATAIVSLSACAAFTPKSLQPGASAEQIRQVMGTPTNQYALADGARRLEFARGPMGKQTYMVDVDANGAMRSWQQVMTEEKFNTIRRGMSREQVMQAIGRPAEIREIAWQHQTLWNFRYDSTFCNFFQVNFNARNMVSDTGYGPDPMCTSPQ